MQVFQVSLPLDKLLIATLSKTCALTASTYVAEERMTIPIYQKHLDYFAVNQKTRSGTKAI